MWIFKKPNKQMFLDWRGYLIGTALVALATILKLFAQPDIISTAISLPYILAIVITAVFYGFGPAIIASIFSVVTYDFFFLEPFNSFKLPNMQVVLTLTIFLLVGVIVSFLTANLRYKTEEAIKESALRKQHEAELIKMGSELTAYARKITRIQEEERKRIAYELHDDTVQYLSILKLQIDSLINSGKIQSPEIIEKLKYLEKDAGRAVDDIRRYSHELRPAILEHLGLKAAMEQITEDVNKLQQMTVELNVEGEEPRLSEDIRLGFFRIAQEAINNARKHSKASKVTINLIFGDSQVKMLITDNGTGFDVQEAKNRISSKGSLGLMSMYERAGLMGADLNIESGIGQGTIVTVNVSSLH
jgi:signal transduction histidine kinase